MPSYPELTPSLGNLNFDDIKQSITDYLKNQDVIKDFNFEGSVMQTLINTLAYNTYYYAFYANMVANEAYLDSAQRLDSIISLTKPLGYFVPLRTAAKATLNLTGLIADVPQYALFRGINDDGVAFNFYTTKSYEEVDSDALGVEIFEGTLTQELNVTNLFDEQKQRFFINDATIDASTIVVKVQKNGATNPDLPKDTWTFSDNFGSVSVANQNVFYLERANNGVYVLFGKVNSLGNKVDLTTDRVFVSYISTNGIRANNIFNFSLITPSNIANNLNIGLVQKSIGGLDTPNLDLIRFAAPKLFGAQNRAVTKEDIKGIVAGFFESPSEFNVYGGEEIFPQRFGRVFFTANLDPDDSDDAVKIQNIYNILNEKCVVTVMPEFTRPNSLSVSNDVSFAFTAQRSAASSSTTGEQLIKDGIKQILARYDSVGEYNFYFNAADPIAEINSTYPDVVITENDFNIYYDQTFVNTDKITINLENEIDIPAFTDYEITSEFKNSRDQTVKLVAYYTSSQNKFDFFDLKTLRKQTDGTFITSTDILGRLNLKKGIIELYAGRRSPVTISVSFKNSYFTTKTNNSVIFTTKSVDIK